MVAQQSAHPQQASLPVGSANVADMIRRSFAAFTERRDFSGSTRLVLEAESTIETGKGSVLLNLQDGSEVLVKAHCRVVLKSPEISKGLYLVLFIGNIIAKVEKRLGNAPAFRMGTPSAVITARGTIFLTGERERELVSYDEASRTVQHAGVKTKDEFMTWILADDRDGLGRGDVIPGRPLRLI